MTLPELEAHYKKAAGMIARERKMREYVFRDQPDKLPGKLAECDAALAAVVAMKDELKRLIAPLIQEMLIDVPPTKKPAGGY